MDGCREKNCLGELAMQLEHPVAPNEESCPVGDQMLGELYRASAHGLNALIATVAPDARALLAMYCYRRAHLASIGLAIAATCEEDDLSLAGGNAGIMLFERSREPLRSASVDAYPNARRQVTMSTGPLRQFSSFDEEDNRIAS
jgi:hypothetical protein